MRSSSRLYWGLFVIVGCGGKIVETAPTFGETASAPGQQREEEPRTQQQVGPGLPPSHPAPATVTSLDACEVLCERDARCDTTLPALPARDGESGDCKTRCEERLLGKCGIDDWLLCYAGAIEPNTCTPLPEECKPAFCAWATCAKQPVSSCQ